VNVYHRTQRRTSSQLERLSIASRAPGGLNLAGRVPSGRPPSLQVDAALAAWRGECQRLCTCPAAGNSSLTLPMRYAILPMLCGACSSMAERLTVAQEVAGSKPVRHPIQTRVRTPASSSYTTRGRFVLPTVQHPVQHQLAACRWFSPTSPDSSRSIPSMAAACVSLRTWP
jgi:hypothetical protein